MNWRLLGEPGTPGQADPLREIIAAACALGGAMDSL